MYFPGEEDATGYSVACSAQGRGYYPMPLSAWLNPKAGQRIRRYSVTFLGQVWKAAILLTLSALLMETAFAEFTGDAELMRLVAEGSRANQEKIQTWQGSVRIRESHSGADHTGAPAERQPEIQVEFAYDLSLQAKRWDISVVEAAQGDSGAAANRNVLRKSRGLLVLDTLYKIGPYSAKGDDSRQPCFVYDISRRPLGLSNGTFDPFYYFTPSPMDYEKRYESLKKSKDRQDSGIGVRSLTRDGDLIIYESVLAGNVNRFTFDMSQGCNLVELYGVGPSSAPYRWSCDYGEIDGVWLPKRITIDQSPLHAGDSETLTEYIEFTNTRLNQDIPESDFSVDALGMASGTAIFDQRIMKQYPYESGSGQPRSSDVIDIEDLGLEILGEDVGVPENSGPSSANSEEAPSHHTSADDTQEDTVVADPESLPIFTTFTMFLVAAAAGLSIWFLIRRRGRHEAQC